MSSFKIFMILKLTAWMDLWIFHSKTFPFLVLRTGIGLRYPFPMGLMGFTLPVRSAPHHWKVMRGLSASYFKIIAIEFPPFVHYSIIYGHPPIMYHHPSLYFALSHICYDAGYRKYTSDPTVVSWNLVFLCRLIHYSSLKWTTYNLQPQEAPHYRTMHQMQLTLCSWPKHANYLW